MTFPDRRKVAGIAFFLPSVWQLMTIPVYIFSTIVAVVFGYYSDKTRHRFPFILAGLLKLFVGFSIQISKAPPLLKYFGWGTTRMASGMAVHIGFGNISIAIASNIFRTQDAPQYLIGFATEFMFVSIGIISMAIAVPAYMHIDAQRAALSKGVGEKGRQGYTAEELREMGDRAPNFRYTI